LVVDIVDGCARCQDCGVVVVTHKEQAAVTSTLALKRLLVEHGCDPDRIDVPRYVAVSSTFDEQSFLMRTWRLFAPPVVRS